VVAVPMTYIACDGVVARGIQADAVVTQVLHPAVDDFRILYATEVNSIHGAGDLVCPVAVDAEVLNQ